MKDELTNLPQLEEAIQHLSGAISEMGIEPDFLIHDNNSSDGSWDYVKAMSERISIRAFRLRRDIGYQESLALAFDNAIGDAFIIIQSDLQDPPEIAIEMIKMWKSGAKSVVGIPTNRFEGFSEKIGRLGFLFLFRNSSDFSNFRWFTDFYLLDESLYKNYQSLPLINQFIRGRLLEDIDFQETIFYTRRNRVNGKTNFRFVKRYNLAVSALLLHSSRMIRRVILFSFLLGMISIVTSGILFTLSVMGVLSQSKIGLYGIALLLCINLTGSSILLGVILEYLLRIHKRLHASNSNFHDREKIYAEFISS